MATLLLMKEIGPKLLPFFESIIIYFILYPYKAETSLLCLVTKCIPIATLCIFVISYGINLKFEYSYSRRIFTGLFFSMIGDACLVYKEDYFIFGIISFAVAHVIYLTAFGIKPFNLRLAFVLIACAIPLYIIYIPILKNNVLKIAVPVYITLLFAMLWRAIARLQHMNKSLGWPWTKSCCTLGALFFVVSDSILSFDMFIMDIPYSHPLIMITYYGAQLGITLSVIDSFTSHEVNHLVIQHHDLIKGVQRLLNYFKSICFEDNIKLIQLNDNNKTNSQETTTSVAAAAAALKVE